VRYDDKCSLNEQDCVVQVITCRLANVHIGDAYRGDDGLYAP
jgi:hypothetical protein